MVGRHVVLAADEQAERDVRQHRQQLLDPGAHVRAPDGALASSPRAPRSLASTRPSPSCFAAKRRSAETTQRVEQPLGDRIGVEEPPVLALDRQPGEKRTACRRRRRRRSRPPSSSRQRAHLADPHVEPACRRPRPRPAAGRSTRPRRTTRRRRRVAVCEPGDELGGLRRRDDPRRDPFRLLHRDVRRQLPQASPRRARGTGSRNGGSRAAPGRPGARRRPRRTRPTPVPCDTRSAFPTAGARRPAEPGGAGADRRPARRPQPARRGRRARARSRGRPRRPPPPQRRAEDSPSLVAQP